MTPHVVMDQMSKVPLKLEFLYGDTKLGIGTGFIYEYSAEHYLITNWHNVTGRDPRDKKPSLWNGGIPNKMRFSFPRYLPLSSNGKDVTDFPEGTYHAFWHSVCVSLYKDDDCDIPRWFEHSAYREKVDLVAIPFDIALTDILPANDASLALEDIPLLPTLDVYVLGFPQGLTGGSRFSVWKRGSIATEPHVDIGGLPKLLIDTATRKGMSGSPVYAEVQGLPTLSGETNAAKLGKRRKFIGVYSGRIGDGEFQAQLGIVRKERVIEEVIKDQIVGASSINP